MGVNSVVTVTLKFLLVDDKQINKELKPAFPYQYHTCLIKAPNISSAKGFHKELDITVHNKCMSCSES